MHLTCSAMHPVGRPMGSHYKSYVFHNSFHGTSLDKPHVIRQVPCEMARPMSNDKFHEIPHRKLNESHGKHDAFHVTPRGKS